MPRMSCPLYYKELTLFYVICRRGYPLTVRFKTHSVAVSSQRVENRRGDADRTLGTIYRNAMSSKTPLSRTLVNGLPGSTAHFASVSIVQMRVWMGWTRTLAVLAPKMSPSPDTNVVIRAVQ